MRQPPDAFQGAVSRPPPEAPRGVLSLPADAEGVAYQRVAPLPELAPFIAHFWMVRWERRGKSAFVAETLPHPCVQVLFEEGRGLVAGVQTRLFRRRLEGEGHVFGIKFRPAAFHPVLRAPLSQLRDRVVSLRSVFGPDSNTWKDALLQATDVERCVALAEGFLKEQLPAMPPRTAELRDLVERLAGDAHILRVEQAAALAGLEVRSLQRLFATAVGVSPKWVLQRYRLHQAAEQLTRAAPADGASLALELGYFDQPHFIRSFKAAVGRPPGAHARKSGP